MICAVSIDMVIPSCSLYKMLEDFFIGDIDKTIVTLGNKIIESWLELPSPNFFGPINLSDKSKTPWVFHNQSSKIL